MDQLKLQEIKDIFRFFKKEGDIKFSFSNKKKDELLQLMKENNLYEIYLGKTDRMNKQKNEIKQLNEEKQKNLDDFNSINQSIVDEEEIEETDETDETDETEDSVNEDEFIDFKNVMIVYGDYREIEEELNEIEDQLNEIEDNEKIKEFLLKQQILGINPKDYKFGNSMQFSTNRGSSHYIIGKNNELIYCTDSDFGDGALVIPKEITKYTNNAQECFDFLHDYPNINIIYLRHDDKFVKQNLDGKILKQWKWIIYYDVREKRINIELPNGNSNDFKLNTKVSEIVIYFQNSEKEQIKIIMNIDYLTSDLNDMSIEDFEPLLPSIWTVKKMGHLQNENKCSINYSYTGPLEQKDDFIEYIKKIYDFENNKNQTNKTFEYEVKSF
jgi:hypothetical protein